ncbi:hypothetical protein PVAG01_03714 [Phlyctema vagabunda]|uniref:Uncharacterized protein n=1 Tax=Phlyctema vagabunda TaxID=108571 RepID=A0ABR4PMI7_9HELO
MSMSQNKRSSSEAGHEPEGQPEPKRWLEDSQNPTLLPIKDGKALDTLAAAASPAPLQDVFAVVEEIKPYSGIINRTTLGLYSTLKDANNEVFKLRSQYLIEGRIPHKEAARRRYLYSGGMDEKGYAWWAFGPDHQAVPFVHGVKVCIYEWVVEVAGDEEAEDWKGLKEWVEEGSIEEDEEHAHGAGEDFYDDEEDDLDDPSKDRPWH